MSYGSGAFHVYYTTPAGEVRKAYSKLEDAMKAVDFLNGLGIDAELDMNTKKKEWTP